MQPLVSVVVPIYNVELYLEECIQSLVRQTYQHIEILLVDDGSTDDSGQIARQYSEQYDHIIYLYKENGGLSDARNAGIDASQGEYLSFVDADDTVDERYVEYLVEAIDTTQENAISVVGFDAIGEGRKIDIRQQFSGELEELSTEEALLKMYELKNYSTIFVSSWGKLFQKSIFDQFRFERGRIFEDQFFNFKAYISASSIRYKDYALYHYRARPNSIVDKMQRQFSSKNLDILLMWTERITYVEQLGGGRGFPDFLEESKFRYLQAYYRLKKLSQLYDVLFEEDQYLNPRKVFREIFPKVSLKDKVRLLRFRYLLRFKIFL
ncbi:glycosyltransferase family 2 protein [Streptococcus sp. ZJ100]|uniref:glycosyltransferase family 2 protein n=1 Tax=Streptococcus handemini TaxID=3161188 RepID=UPI0032ECB49D